MAKNKLPSVDYLRQRLDYDPDTGTLRWKARPRSDFACGRKGVADAWNRRYAGEVAGGKCAKNRYVVISINSQSFNAHRVIWKWMHDEEPTTVDHINGDGFDNRLANLRNVSQFENCRNSAIFNTNTSGFRGVSWDKTHGRWVAYIVDDGKRHHIGRFETLLDAAEARKFAEKVFGFHPNHGKRYRL